MARAPGLASPTLSPFGGSGAGFGAFSITDPGREAYLIFLKAENSWQNGQLTDAAYLAAMRTYADALPEGTSTRINTEQRILETTYRVERNVFVSKVNNNQASLEELLAFDYAKLQGLNPDSQEGRDRLDTYRNTQQRLFREDEDAVVSSYQDGLITTAALQAWYRTERGQYLDNPELIEALDKRVTELDGRVLDERDARTIQDYNDGKMADAQFITYAGAARARYATGTAQADEWDRRISTAQKVQAENGLLYRYGLSQQYAELQRFIKSNAGGAGGGASTSTTKRIVLGADGQWRTITSTSTKGVAPTAAQQEAYRNLQIQIADAKKQMTEIVGKLGAVPDAGSWVTTDSMISYYQVRQRDLAVGSADWYAVQQKIDSLQERKHAETVLGQQGIRITYPGAGAQQTGTTAGGGDGPAPTPTARTTSGGGTTSTSGAGTKPKPTAPAASSVTIDSFLSSLAGVSSGNRYDATNDKTGSFGKYQISPSNWAAWAQTYLGDASADYANPANQELVAKAKVADLYKWLGSWDAVAYWWKNGGSKETATNPANWTTTGRSFVTGVMGSLGQSTTKTPSAGAGTTNRGTLGGLTQIVSINTPLRRSGTASLNLKATSFPVNLDGQAFTNFYRAYERAFNSGEEVFVDASSGTPIAYFIGDDPEERIQRMRDLDDLRVRYYQERAVAYAGTPSELEAHNLLNGAVQDAAAHEYRILNTIQGQSVRQPDGSTKYVPSKGTENETTGFGSQPGTNPIAAGVRLIDKTMAAIALEQKAAQAAYDRGDFQAAYAHLQLAQAYVGKRQQFGDTTAEQQLIGLGNQANASIAAIMANPLFQGISASEALGQEGGGKFQVDLDRLQNAQAELETVLTDGDDLRALIESQIKRDPRTGKAVLDDRTGQVQLADGYSRMVSESGKVTIEPIKTSMDPQTGREGTTPTGNKVKVFIKTGSGIQEAWADWKPDTVGYIKNPGGTKNIPLTGKKVTILVDGKYQVMYEDPLNPGHWNSSAIVYNTPTGFNTIPDGKGGSLIQFQVMKQPDNAPGGSTTAQPTDWIVYTLQFDPTSGTYIALGNRPASAAGFLFGRSELVNEPPPSGLSALLEATGFTRDTTQAAGGGGFVDVQFPVIGATPDEFQKYLNPTPAAWMKNQPLIPLNSTGSPDDRGNAITEARRKAAFAGMQNLAAARRGQTAEDADLAAAKAKRLGPLPGVASTSVDPLSRQTIPGETPLGDPSPPPKPLAPIKLPTLTSNPVPLGGNATKTGIAPTTTKTATTTKTPLGGNATKTATTVTAPKAPAPAPAPTPVAGTQKLTNLEKLI